MSVQIRPATIEDADGVAAVHVRAWQETYAHLLPAEFLAALDPAPRAVRWRAIIDDDETTVWVAVEGDHVIGWATTSDGRDVDRPRGRELEGIYVLASSHGSGVGQALLDASVGDTPAYLWVAADNPRATAFYRRNGFVADGVRTSHELLGVDVDVVRLVR